MKHIHSALLVNRRRTRSPERNRTRTNENARTQRRPVSQWNQLRTCQFALRSAFVWILWKILLFFLTIFNSLKYLSQDKGRKIFVFPFLFAGRISDIIFVFYNILNNLTQLFRLRQYNCLFIIYIWSFFNRSVTYPPDITLRLWEIVNRFALRTHSKNATFRKSGDCLCVEAFRFGPVKQC
jgi:hypothetical protein